PLMREYAAIFNTPVVTWITGWEKFGAPSGPVDIFPPYEGEEIFRAAMAEATRDGNHPFMYVGGFQWTYRKPMVGYDGWERFEREGRKMAALDDCGGLIISDISRRPYQQGQRYFVAMCTGSNDAQELLVNNFLRLMDLGAVAVSLDIQLGLYAYVCYSDQHGHTPGYGPWMYYRTLEFLRRVRREVKHRNPEAAMGYEKPCEVWIQEADYQYHRPYWVGYIPLFDYVYGAYTCRLGGDAAMGLCHPEVELIKHATCFVYGVTQNLVGIGLPEYDFEVDPAYPALTLIRNICEAQRTYAREYVVFGEMLRPTRLDVPRVTVDLYRRPGTVDMPRILHGVWRSPDGNVGYVLINWTGTSVEGKLALVEEQKYQSSSEFRMVTGKDVRTIPRAELHSNQLTVAVPPRSVLLVEQRT
ncbi:MAG: DUF6259 domain-containing protein, partial [Anaerolineales bacterium]